MAELNQRWAKYTSQGVQLVGINSNDPVQYPDDSYAAMQARVQQIGHNFPYLVDETQATAHAYGAVCTPDFFVYDQSRQLVYRGRFDDNWKNSDAVTVQDLPDAVEAVLGDASVNNDQKASMGCSIKWK